MSFSSPLFCVGWDEGEYVLPVWPFWIKFCDYGETVRWVKTRNR